MLVTLKNLQQQTFHIQIDDTRTVLELKEEIFRQLGQNYPIERQKLIYSGVILLDDRSLSSYNVSENKFIVVMVSRNAVGTQTDSREPNNSEERENVQSTENERPNQNRNQVPPDVESSFVTGEEYERSVNVLMEMGFSRELVARAMTASFNNPERAFEYLVNGLPENLSNEDAATATATDGDGTNAVRGVLDVLSQNPTLLRAVLENIGIGDSNTVQQILNNPGPFLETLNQIAENQHNNLPAFQNIPPEQLSQLVSGMAQNTRSQGDVEDGATQNQNNTASNLARDASLTETEQEAVNRIRAMGFPAERVLQAFIICEKNEELTVDFLLSNND